MHYEMPELFKNTKIYWV